MAKGPSRFVLLISSLLLIVSACGGGDEAATDASGGDSTVAPPTTQTTTTASPPPAPTLVPSSIPNFGGLSAECEGLANVMLGIVQVFAGSIEGSDQLFAAGIGSLPDEIRSDIELLEVAVTEFAAGIEELGINPFLDPQAFAQLTPEQLTQFEEVAAVFNDDEVDAAFANVEDYGARECDSFGVNR